MLSLVRLSAQQAPVPHESATGAIVSVGEIALLLPATSKRARPGRATTASTLAAAPVSLCLCHGRSTADWRFLALEAVAAAPDDCSPRKEYRDLTTEAVANHSSRVEPADACFRECIGAAWQLLTVAPMLRPRRAMCVRHRLLAVIRAKVGKHWIARPRLMLCL